MIEKYIYITHFPKKIKEGGGARNYAFYSFFINKKETISYNIYRKYYINRILITLYLTIQLLFESKHTIFIHQGTLLYLYPKVILRFSIGKWFYAWMLKYISNKNRLILEINDLPYEQSIDLGLPVYPEYLDFQRIIFSIKRIHFIFAANEMKRYACLKYNIPDAITSVIINGGPSISEKSNIDIQINKDEINYIYAGTLNKGRQIEKLIDLFSIFNSKNLFLIGSNGEWINTLNLPNNIKYLGNYEEAVAHWIVSQCDIGIIPYDSSKLYYNICYPTKVSFYLTANIAILSTPLSELINYHKEFIFFEEWEKWDIAINSINKKDIILKKEVIKNTNQQYKWINLLNNRILE